jgi:ribose/xylose/arabinose/galactoside ABC-type transport system permease subunit
LVFARGLAKQLSGAQKVSTYVQTADGEFVTLALPAIYTQIDSRVLGGHVAVVTLVFVGCAGLGWVVLSRHKLGRYLLAIGGNPEAARLSGVPVSTALVSAYVPKARSSSSKG